jgi:hypothetical protein
MSIEENQEIKIEEIEIEENKIEENKIEENKIEENKIEENVPTSVLYKKLQSCVENMGVDLQKFREKKVKAAGQRVRNNLLNAKKMCDGIRKSMMSEMRDIPTKHRILCDGIESRPNTPVKKSRKPRKANVVKE